MSVENHTAPSEEEINETEAKPGASVEELVDGVDYVRNFLKASFVRMGRNPDDTLVDDLVQETMVQTLLNKDTFLHKSALKSWMVAVAKNVMYGALRNKSKDAYFKSGDIKQKKNRAAPKDSKESDDDGTDELDLPARNIEFDPLLRKRIEAATKELAPTEQQTLQYLLKGIGPVEMAAELKISKSTGGTRYFYLFRKLRSLLQKQYEEVNK